jgi:hypothetical protein
MLVSFLARPLHARLHAVPSFLGLQAYSFDDSTMRRRVYVVDIALEFFRWLDIEFKV